jgi:hypothetical protein
MDLHGRGVVPAVNGLERAGLTGRVVLAEASGVAAFCGLCVALWLVMATVSAGGGVLLVALVAVGVREPPLGWFARACGQGGWSPWEGSGAR